MDATENGSMTLPTKRDAGHWPSITARNNFTFSRTSEFTFYDWHAVCLCDLVLLKTTQLRNLSKALDFKNNPEADWPQNLNFSKWL